VEFNSEHHFLSQEVPYYYASKAPLLRLFTTGKKHAILATGDKAYSPFVALQIRVSLLTYRLDNYNCSLSPNKVEIRWVNAQAPFSKVVETHRGIDVQNTLLL